MYLLNVHAACPCCMSLPHVLVECSCCMAIRMSKLKVLAACLQYCAFQSFLSKLHPCCFSMLHLRATYTVHTSAYPCQCSTFLALSMSLLHVHAVCLLNVNLYVHAACPCCMSLLHVLAACLCCMSVLYVHAACPCHLSMPHVYAACS
jgi:hypothetical protein